MGAAAGQLQQRVGSTPRLPAQDTRQKILDAARPVIAGKGFAAVGLSEILAAAAVPKGSFYHYFASKEQFGGELLVHYFEAYLRDMDERLAAPGIPAGARLMSLFSHWHQTQSGQDLHARCLMVKLSAEVCDLSESMRAALEHGSAQTLDRLAQCLADGQATGEFSRALDPRQGAQHLYQWWLGAILLARVQRSSDALDAALRGTRQWLQAAASAGSQAHDRDTGR